MKALVIIPTYNEKENLEAIIEAVLRQDSMLNILVVDDNSPDGTGQIAERISRDNNKVHVLHRQRKMGLGQAYIAGFKYALEHKYDFVFEMDADFSHDPKYLPEFLKSLETADLVLGSRYVRGVNVVNWPMSRLLLSYFANVYSRWITGVPVRDSTGGFKCYRRAVLEGIELDKIKSEGYSFQIETCFRAWKKGFRIKEIPIIFVDRRAGHSKMSKRIVREAIWVVWKLRILSLLGKI
ncbi:MAG: polyprenol monophosphomannose synthase [candidate division Zixibacteria bacterium]|nr:polyprenol monophosphomannose synthase [candidate division Zixibacteria bacterium]